MALKIPTSTTLGRYRFSITLDNVVFIFVLVFNRRDSRWYFDLLDNEGTAIRQGVKITANWLLLRQLVQQGRPAGSLMAVDPQGDADPGLTDLGAQSILTYLPAE